MGTGETLITTSAIVATLNALFALIQRRLLAALATLVIIWSLAPQFVLIAVLQDIMEIEALQPVRLVSY
jgi:hypothetical protein